MSLKAIHNHIIFKFERSRVRATGTDRMQFKEETNWGFDLGQADQGFDVASKEAQWGIVIRTGHKVRELKVGDRVLIEPLKWTIGIDVDGSTYWRTDEDCIMVVDESVN